MLLRQTTITIKAYARKSNALDNKNSADGVLVMVNVAVLEVIVVVVIVEVVTNCLSF